MKFFDIFRRNKNEVSAPQLELDKSDPVRLRVLLIIHNPIVRSQGNRKFSELFRWNNPDRLVKEYIQDVRNVSHGYANGDIRSHHLWWLRHLPHVNGSSSGISHNWWEYILDSNRAA